jgi:hypothetical protein
VGRFPALKRSRDDEGPLALELHSFGKICSDAVGVFAFSEKSIAKKSLLASLDDASYADTDWQT